MRDRVIHGYDHVDIDMVWETVRDHLPGIGKSLETILATDSSIPPEV